MFHQLKKALCLGCLKNDEQFPGYKIDIFIKDKYHFVRFLNERQYIHHYLQHCRFSYVFFWGGLKEIKWQLWIAYSGSGEGEGKGEGCNSMEMRFEQDLGSKTNIGTLEVYERYKLQS